MVLITIESIIQLCLLIIVGIIFFKIGLIKQESTDSISAILVHMSLPALLLRSFQSDILFENKGMLLPALFISGLMQGAIIVIGYIFVRNHKDANVERASIAFTNNSFIGIPLLGSIFGEIGVFYGNAFNTISSFTFFSVLPAMLSGSVSVKECIRKTFNDKVIVCIGAIILLIADIRLPEFIMTPVGWMADLTSPLAMILVGCIIATSDFSHMFNLRVVWVSVVRLIISPIIICIPLMLLLKGDNTALLSFGILSAMPTGTLVTIFAEQEGANIELSSGIYLLTTVACAATIPLIVFMLELIPV